MDVFQSVVSARGIFVLGLINLLGTVLILLSCRCVAGSKIIGGLMKYSAYQRFYGYHCYIWWVFLASVIVHVLFGITFLGFPF